MLPPGLPALTDSIRVRSIVGRFLEHTRVLYFRWGDSDDDEALYLSSADWMGRNMFRRIEVAWPVRDARLRQRVIDECLVPYLHDDRDAWELRADGRYEARRRRGTSSAQQALMQRFAAGCRSSSTDGPDPLAPRRSGRSRPPARTTSTARSRTRASARPQRMAEWLNQRAARPARASSSARRSAAQQTAQALGRKFTTVDGASARAPARRRCSLPRAGPTPREPVLVVGHQPTLGLVAAHLLADQPQTWADQEGRGVVAAHCASATARGRSCCRRCRRRTACSRRHVRGRSGSFIANASST